MNLLLMKNAQKTAAKSLFRHVPRAAFSALACEVTDEITAILQRASEAQHEFLKLSQEDADHVFDAVAHEANKQRVPLARHAVAETKMGCFEDKVMKNGLACELIHDRYRDTKTCGLVSSEPAHGKYTYAFGAGPVCALTPVTNPTSTAIAKSLFFAKTRNAGVFLPHPRASDCTAAAVRVCNEAGVSAGAPEGWVQCVDHPTLDISKQVMESPEIKLILSTGGPGVVRASYKSGKPAIGVGGGNAPVLVDELADLRDACGYLVLGKTFDNGVICAAEQSVVVVDSVYEEFKEMLKARGVYFLNESDRQVLAEFIYKDGRINVDIVGQTAHEIARRAGIQAVLPNTTVVLGTEESAIGPENPLSAEKLSPVLSMYRARDFNHGVDLCEALAFNGGVGHTAGIYTGHEGHLSDRVHLFAQRVPVGRVIVNAPTSLSAIGTAFNFNLDPSFTLGVGTAAGSSLSSALTPMHLINTVTVAEKQSHMEWYNLPQQIYFNRGCLEESIRQCAKPDANGNRCRRALVVTDMGMRRCGHLTRLLTALHAEGFDTTVFDQVKPDPDIECVRHGVQACEAFQPDIMFCLGGGSPIDAGKFIRVQYEHPELTLQDAASRFIELRKRTMEFPKLGSKIKSFVACPTTSGTGSEVSPFTVITDENGHKYPIASYRLTPDIAICDSTLTDEMPKSVVAYAGADAVVHAVESYVSICQNDFTKQQSQEALTLLFKNLPDSYEKGTPASRDGAHRGATIAGIAFSNAFLGVCHSLAHRVGAEFHLPHGLAVSILLPHVIRYNATDSPTRQGIYPGYSHPQSRERYSELARAIGAKEETPEGLIRELVTLFRNLDLPTSFEEAGVDKAQYFRFLTTMAEEAFDEQCTPANPRFPLVPELEKVLAAAYVGEGVE